MNKKIIYQLTNKTLCFASVIILTSFSSLGQYLVNFDGTSETKGSYASGTVNLSGLDWNLTEALLGSDQNDFFNGTRSARLRGYGTSSMTMLEDKSNGLGSISFEYSEYGTDNQTTWRVEYSTDEGTNWTQIGTDFEATGGNGNPETFSESVQISGDIRIRIIEVGGAGTTNLRMNIDDILLTDFIVATPTITAAPSLLSGFLQIIGSPSSEQSFTTEGNNLSDDITINVVSGDYEISTDAAGPYSTSLTLNENAGEVASTTIFVRLNGSAVANPANGQIELTSTGATTQTVDLEGEIILAPTSIIIDFEGAGEMKGGYAAGTVNLSGLDWELDEVLIGSATNDFFNGTRSARLRGYDNANMTMLEDKANGLGEITFEYREYGTDSNQQPWNVEYSTDQGATWNLIGTFTATDVVQTFSETVNVTGDVRVRIIIASTPGTSGDRRANVDDIELTNFTPDPEVSVTPSLLTGFLQTVGSPSAEQSFTVEGNYLDDNVTVAVSAGDYEIADNAGGPWSTSITLNETNGAVASTTLFVRLNGATPSNPSNGIVTISSLNAQSEELQLEGVIQAAGTPTITATPSALSGFSQTVGVPSAEQIITVSGSDLDADIELNLAGTDFEISTTSGSGFAQSLTLTENNGEVAATTIYVRLNGTAVNANVTDQINLSSTGAQNQFVSLSGEIITAPTVASSVSELTGFFQVIGTPSIAQNFDVSGDDLVDDVTITVTTGDYEIADDAGGPWVSSLTYTQNGGELAATPVYVRLNGTTAQNPAEGEITISSTNAVDVVVDLTGEIQEANDPLITASPLSLTGFSQETGAPSTEQSFDVEGSDLNDDIELSATNDYEISTDIVGPYSTSLTLTQTSGSVASIAIYVRLNGSAIANPANGQVIITSTDADDVVIELEGEIIQGCNIDNSVTLDNFVLTAVEEDMNYQWIDCNDNLAWIPGENDQSFVPSQDGTYAVIITQDATCIDTSDCILVEGGASTVNHSFEAGIDVYPNPVNDHLNIFSMNAAITTVSVYTMEGKLVEEVEINANEALMNTSNWTKGAYQVVIRSSDSMLVRKVIK
jgi:hypothetical protein